MKRSITLMLRGAALAAGLYAAAAFSAYPAAPVGQADRGTRDGGRTLMTPAELAVLKEQVRRASTPAKAPSRSERAR